ncbi:hypothetical protein D3C80_1972920 [compost metagenome]
MQRTVAVGFAQFSAGVDRIFGARAGDRCPEEHGAGIGVEILVLVTAHQSRGVDGGRRAADGNAEVPGCEIDHRQSVHECCWNGRARSSGPHLRGRSL